MTVAEYFEECKTHDWYAIFSDDFRWEQAAACHMEELKLLAKESELFERILDAWHSYSFSGSMFSREQLPVPKLEDFE